MSEMSDGWVLIDSDGKILFGPAWRYECEDWADDHWGEWQGSVEIIKQSEYEETR